jgi:hypothetical protein
MFHETFPFQKKRVQEIPAKPDLYSLYLRDFAIERVLAKTERGK